MMTLARAIVLAGSVVSMSADCSAQTLRILVPPEGTSETSARGISKNGRYIAGWAITHQGFVAVVWGPSRRPVVLPTAGESDLAYSVSDDGTVAVGSSDGRAAIWTPQGVLLLGQGEARDVDAAGGIAVVRLGSWSSYAYHISTGTLVELLRPPGSIGTRVNAVNSDGTLAVGEGGVVWNTGDGEVVTVLRTGLYRVEATGISDDGRIVGGDVEDHGGFFASGRWVDGVFSECWYGSYGSPGVVDLSGDGNTLFGWTVEDGAVMWDTSHGYVPLSELLEGPKRYLPQRPEGISGNAGRMVGEGWNVDRLCGWEVVLCPADFNADSVIDFFDYLDYVEAFAAEQPAADLNTDGQVDFFDYLDFVQAFDAGCE
jgi:hypothetical protein